VDSAVNNLWIIPGKAPGVGEFLWFSRGRLPGLQKSENGTLSIIKKELIRLKKNNKRPLEIKRLQKVRQKKKRAGKH